MAQVPYEGAPTVAPDTRAPDDYQHEQATPAEAGALIGQGLEKAGQGLSQTSQNLFDISQFYGKINVDDQVNHWITDHNKILYGDPSKTTLGPDGKPVADTGFYGLEGRAASDQRQATLDQIEQLRLDGRKNLKTPQEQFEYDTQTRRMYADTEQRVGVHTDQQWKSWAGGVNSNGADLALTSIARDPDDLENFQHQTKDYINFRVQEAQLKFGDDPTITRQAIDTAKAEATAARLQAVAVKDPSRALTLLDSYKNVTSVVDRKTGQSYYDQLSTQFRARADEQTGTTAGSAAVSSATLNHPYANPTLPLYRDATTAAPKGYSTAGLARTIQIESGGDPNAANGDHKGLGQFSPATWKEFGQGEPTDPQAAILATQKYAAANKPILQLALNRPPTDAELYLAHQQGPFGATKLLQNPNVRAGSLVGDAAIAGNGGDPNAPAAAFTAMWAKRFNDPGDYTPAAVGQPGASPRSLKADAYTSILNNSDLSIGARNHAIQYVNQTLAATSIAQDNDEKARKVANDTAADDYSKVILSGKANEQTIAQIVTDPRITNYETREKLVDIARGHAGTDIAGASMAYGPGFWSAYKGVTAGLGDPNKISDVTALLNRAGPGGDLTLAGVQKLRETMQQGEKSVNDNSVVQTTKGLLDYAKSKLSFEQDTGPIKIRDPKGEALFSGKFIPKFYAALDQSTKDGGDPWKFLTQDTVDKMLAGMRSKSDMAADRVASLGESQELPAEQKDQPIPPPPEGVDADGWTTVMAKPPVMATGLQATRVQYRDAVETLRANPTPQAKASFNKWFGADGAKADDVIGKLNPAAEKKPDEPAAAAPTADEALSPVDVPPSETVEQKLGHRSGPGAAGYLGDLIRSVTPHRVQEYLQNQEK